MTRALTISVVSHGQGDLAQRLLDDLAALRSPDIDRVVVTRNIPEVWTPTWSSPEATLVVIDNPQPMGFGANHNAAARVCASPSFAVLNPDLRLSGDPFAPLLDLLRDPSVALVAPTIVGPDGRIEDAARPLITPFEIVGRRLRPEAPTGEPAWLAGMCLLVRTDVFRQLGGFDERYHLYCEDFDLCARLRLAGWDFRIAPNVRVTHAARRTSHRSLQHLRWHIASLLRMWTTPVFWRYRRQLAARQA
jgi:N-acetylglucosaminyl-diphospho-decaprenol L-rhamnosyltransferase